MTCAVISLDSLKTLLVLSNICCACCSSYTMSYSYILIKLQKIKISIIFEFSAKVHSESDREIQSRLIH